MARDYYGLLGVGQGAGDAEIKRAYRKLARELHPDVNPDAAAQARFKEISAAYEVLSDPEKRRIVDLGGDPLENSGLGGGGFTGFGGLGDVFEAFFGGGTASRGPTGRVRPGSDSLLRMRLDLAECATGVTKQVTVDTAVLCDKCQGKGTNGDSRPVSCDTCGGRGEVQSVQRSLLGQVMTSRPCPTCRGVGEVIPDPCHRCGGDGRVRSRREISVKIPAGVGDGMRVRLAAQGEVGPGGGPA
ncbi:MAG TPA: DnaJ domain-containing protein, partial [Mycobacterium sp.]|nr:DnaJ domain-containing protein [Mycobacterium sp.]